jgi:hypothetical protein
MVWVLRQRGVMDAELERQLFHGTSEAIASLPHILRQRPTG